MMFSGIKKMNDYVKIGSLIVILFTVAIFYRRYDDKLTRETGDRNDEAIRDYLLTDPSKLGPVNVTRPILWIPVVYSYNSRKWDSFGSRSSYDLNQPYLYLCVKSIIKHCKDSFHICLVDDTSYKRLMPEWEYDLGKVAAPLSDHLRKLAIARLLKVYGGMTVPPNFVCLRNLMDMHETALQGMKTMYVIEAPNKTLSNEGSCFTCSTEVMGCKQKSKEIVDLVSQMEKTIASDYTSEQTITGNTNKWCNFMQRNGKISMIDAHLVGYKDKTGEKVGIEELLGSSYVHFTSHCYGFVVPAEEILNRHSYEWFTRMSGHQVLESQTMLGKYLLITNIPGNQEVLEPDDSEPPEWIAFWQVPLKKDLYGVKPNYLGNKLIHDKSLK